MLVKGRITINIKLTVVFICALIMALTAVHVIFDINLNNSSRDNLIRVACIGDSITASYGYPEFLQNTLGDKYNVKNFGVSSSTVLTNTEKPYIYEVTFTRAKEFEPDIAVVMLGTNDARTDYFKSIDNFVKDYLILIYELEVLKSDPQIFLVKPPPILNNTFSLENKNMVDGIIPRIEQIADEKGLLIIDVYSALENHPEYFSDDGVHPNSQGAATIANTVYNAITNSMEAS